MSKFHINSKGIASPCRATKGKCPFGGENEHYSSKEEAQSAAERNNEKEYGLISNVESQDSSTFEGRNSILKGIKNSDERERKAQEMFVETEVKPKFEAIRKSLEENSEAMSRISKLALAEKDEYKRKWVGDNPVEAVEAAYSQGKISESEINSMRESAIKNKEFKDNLRKTRADLEKSVETYIDFNVVRNGRAKSDLIYEFKDETLSDMKVLGYLSNSK